MGAGLLALAPVVTAGIGAAGSAISSAVGANAAKKLNQSQIDMQRETNAQNYQIWQESQDFSREQADTQWEREKEMFNMENQYNNPIQVVDRLRKAGINPSLAMQGSLGSAMSASASGGSPTIGSTPTAPQMQAANIMNSSLPMMYANMATGVSDGLVKASQMMKNLADAKKTGIDTSYLEQSIQYRIKKDMQDARYAELMADLYEEFEPQRLSKELAKLDKENRKLDNEINKLIKEGKYIEAQRRLQDLLGDKQVIENNYLSSYYHEKEKYIPRQVKAETESTEEDVKLKKNQGVALLKNAEAALLSASASMLSAEAQDYLAHNPNDFTSLLTKVVTGYIGTPEEFGKMLKEKGVLGVVYDMTIGERDKFFKTLSEQWDMPFKLIKRGFTEGASGVTNLFESLRFKMSPSRNQQGDKEGRW